MTVAHRRSPLSDFNCPCYFCGRGEDSAEHVFGECTVVRAARAKMGAILGCKLGDDFATTLLSFPPVDNKAVSVGIVCFNWAVWTERTEFLSVLGHRPTGSYLVNRIMLRAQSRVPADRNRCTGRGEDTVANFARHPPADATIA